MSRIELDWLICGPISSMSDHELYHYTVKPIGDEEDTFQSFIAFDIIPCKFIFRAAVRSRILVPPIQYIFELLIFCPYGHFLLI